MGQKISGAEALIKALMAEDVDTYLFATSKAQYTLHKATLA